jgi:L,D-transpeptidase catalytic domain
MKSVYVVAGLFLSYLCSAAAQSRIDIDLTNQRAYLIQSGRVVLDSPICSGRPGHLTPIGTFKVTDKDLNHASSFYGFFGNPVTKQIVIPDADTAMKVPSGLEFVHAPMRYYMQFKPAIGLHSGFLPGHPDSHGCVRMPEEYATSFFQAVKIGTPVHVFGQPQPGRSYWSSHRFTVPPLLAPFGRLVSLETSDRRDDERANYKRARHAAFQQFDADWDARKKAVERQIDGLEDRKDRSEGWQKDLLKQQIRELEEYKDEMEIRRDAAKDSLERRWGGD